MIDVFLPALLLSFVLLGIHSYFGIRIIERNIIFTDLAIGQMAALGAAVSLFFFEGKFLYFSSFTGALMAGLLISFMMRRTGHPEALIGLLYALGISSVFIVLSRSPHGMEEFQNLLAYDIIFTNTREIVAAGALYLVIGAVLLISNRIKNETAREVIFFVCFSATVTSSVKIAGVLVVFAILLAPAFIAISLLPGMKVPGSVRDLRLPAAWITGIILNVVSIIISYYGDLPTGYTLVFCNAFAAIIVAICTSRRVSGT